MGITTLEEADEVHPVGLVTLKVQVPDGMSEIVMLVPVPEEVISPGERVSVQIPVAGKPLKTTLPVGTVHVGRVIVPTTGAEGLAFTVKV